MITTYHSTRHTRRRDRLERIITALGGLLALLLGYAALVGVFLL